MVIHIKKEDYEKLSDSERRVVDFLNQNEIKVPTLSITQIAAHTFTSAATVTRAIKKCGFSGIAHLRYAIAEEGESKAVSPYTVNEILAKTYRECTKTIENVCVTDILKTIELIKKARRIFIYSRGFTTLVSEEFQMSLQILGYDTVIVKDVNWMKNTRKIVTKDDLIIILSVRNSTKALAESAHSARRQGATVVSCCCKGITDK